MAQNIMAAHNQWKNRKSDERFWTTDEMLDSAKKCQDESSEITCTRSDINFDAPDDDTLRGFVGDVEVEMTNFAFKRMCGILDAPIDSLIGKISAKTIAQILNERADRSDEEHEDDDGVTSEIKALIRNDQNDSRMVLRTITSDKYARFFDAGMRPLFDQCKSLGYKIPPCRPVDSDQPRIRKATAEEVGIWGNGGIQVREGDDIAPGNVYRSDRNSFVLMANPDMSKDDGFGHGLIPFLIVWNSEVGERSFGIMTGTMQGVCGNACLWGCEDVVTTKFKHMGKIHDKFTSAWEALRQTGPIPVPDNLIRVMGIMAKEKLGADADTVVNTLYKQRISPALTQKIIRAAIVNAEQHVTDDGDPYTLLGITNALTRYSQTLPNTDARFNVDQAVAMIYDKVAKANDIAPGQ